VRLLLALLAAAALVGRADRAAAQNAKAAADAAFANGKKLMAAGDAPGACAAFEESERLDPQLGTQYNLALCDEQLGRLTSAWVNFSEVAAKDSRGPRKDDAARRAHALEPRLARLTIVVRAPAQGEVVKVGALDLSVLAGSASPIDEGSYDVVADAPGRVRWHGHVEVRGEGATVTLEVPALEAQATPVAPVVHHSHRRAIALGLAGAGVLAIGAGLFAGKHVYDLKSQAETACGHPLDQPCTGDLGQAQMLVNDARTWATASDVAIGVGGGLVVGAAILYLTAPRTPRDTALVPVIAPDAVGLSFAGQF
jgi:hypothetical protein